MNPAAAAAESLRIASGQVSGRSSGEPFSALRGSFRLVSQTQSNRIDKKAFFGARLGRCLDVSKDN